MTHAHPEAATADQQREVLEAAILAVVHATRAYLPPDGITAQECISLILGATDNPTINPIIAEIENGRT